MTMSFNWSLLLKIAGSVMILTASVLGGLYASGLDSFRIHDLNEMKKALTILKSEIGFAASPLSEALKNIAARTERPVNSIFTRLAERLDERCGESVSELWSWSVRHNKTRTYYTDEDLECLYSFGKTLGYLDKNMQIAAIEILIETINGKVDMLNAAAVKNRQMYRSLGILGGLLAIVIFF